MANNSLGLAGITFNGACPAPFLDLSDYPHTGGNINGRFCGPSNILPGGPSCCLPCPATQWVYSESFNRWAIASDWLNVVGLVLLVFMLASYAFLPSQKTRSHYLSICLVICITFLALGFTIPLAAQPDQCYDGITPNDMYSSMECAWSGAFIIAGGMAAVVWIFIRALSMNLQICWDIVPGQKFFYVAQALGWGISAVLFTTTITLTGVSFRFGTACHVNHGNARAGFWGPLMGIAACAGILQLATFGYCIHVYLKSLWSDDESIHTSSSANGGLPSYNASVRTQTARAVFERIKKVLWLQWRGIAIVTIILADVVFFTVIFLTLDSMQANVADHVKELTPWYACLVTNIGNSDVCLHYVQGWLVNEGTVIAVLVLLGLAGLQSFLLLMRPSVFRAWWDLLTGRWKKQEFVSLDATRNASQTPRRTASKQALLRLSRGPQATTFEMQQKKQSGESEKTQVTVISKPGDVYSPNPGEAYPFNSPSSGRGSPLSDDGMRTTLPTIMTTTADHRGRIPNEYVGRITPSPVNGAAQGEAQNNSSYNRRYPNSSFSNPRAPSRNNRQSQAGSAYSDSRSVSRDFSYPVRGGLAMNPPSEAGESRDSRDDEWRREVIRTGRF
ncbi:unnamed protein product [Zymoseptoria tritici ST99CH_3D1]|nr:unnamed protein product [Zymoseptoria tritici ST99CH_3D1]